MELLYSGEHFTTHHNIMLFDKSCDFPPDLVSTEQHVYSTPCQIVVTVDTDCDIYIAIYAGEGAFPDFFHVSTAEMFLSEEELYFCSSPGSEMITIRSPCRNIKISVYLDNEELYKAKKVVFLLQSKVN